MSKKICWDWLKIFLFKFTLCNLFLRLAMITTVLVFLCFRLTFIFFCFAFILTFELHAITIHFTWQLLHSENPLTTWRTLTQQMPFAFKTISRTIPKIRECQIKWLGKYKTQPSFLLASASLFLAHFLLTNTHTTISKKVFSRFSQDDHTSKLESIYLVVEITNSLKF